MVAPKPKPPGFTPLPAALIWPNLEGAIISFFISGVVEKSAAVLGGYGRGIVDDNPTALRDSAPGHDAH